MGKLKRISDEARVFIVQRLACFETPSIVAEAVRDEFGIDITRQSVEGYDPTRIAGKGLAKKWKALFTAAREEFINDTSSIAISHKTVRLHMLQRMALKADEKGNIPLAAQLLEQAAKECGDAYTNRQRHEHTGKDGKPIETRDLSKYGDDELDRRIKELEGKVARGGKG
jgi:hypothetical protein